MTNRPLQHHLVLVPHTHWDREWYRTHEQFRFKLVQLVDELLDLLEQNPEFRHFTLDGQAIAVDDYVEIRPGARERLAKLVSAGRLLVGPWYVLPDEWLVSGEALLRNLRIGLGRAEALGGAMRLGYVPDQFGHVGQLPQIFAGFGFEAAALWRGVGEDVEETLFDWEAPDGSRILTVYLSRSYSNAAHLPRDPEAFRRRLDAEIAGLGKRSRVPVLLLMTGTDHQRPDPLLPDLLRAALAARDDVSGEIGTLPGFIARARSLAPPERPLHRGELRSGLRAPLLPGCASTRLPQKRADFENDRLLVHGVEPLSAWLSERGGRADVELLDHVWRLALQNHPHDSICGCSIDEVHRQMDTRFAQVRQIAEAERARVFRALATQLALPEHPDAGWLCVWNPAAAGRTSIEAEVEIEELPDHAPAEAWHLCGLDGEALPTDARRLRPPEQILNLSLPRTAAPLFLDHDFSEMFGYALQDVGLEEREGCLRVFLHLGEAEPAEDDVRERRARAREAVAQSAAEQVELIALTRARWRIASVAALPAHGLRSFRLCAGAPPEAADLASDRSSIANRHWRVTVDPRARVSLEHRASGVRREDALRVVSESDRGDEYNFDPVLGAPWVAAPERVEALSAGICGARAVLRWRAVYRVPEALAQDRASCSERDVELPVDVELCLWSDVDRLDVCVALENTARDHRLRLWLAAPEAAQRFEVESAFEVAERPIEPPAPREGERIPAEWPVGSTPQRSFASLHGQALCATVANRGLTEVEAIASREPDGVSRDPSEPGWLAITLLRAVGWLSRGDLGLRPAHAGPPLATPGAQVPGPHRAELSLRWHPSGDPVRTAEAHRFSRGIAALQLSRGEQSAAVGALADGASLIEVGDPRIVVSAVEPAPGGGAWVRVYNASGEELRTWLHWGGACDRILQRVDLRGRPIGRAARRPADRSQRWELALGAWELAGFAVSAP